MKHIKFPKIRQFKDCIKEVKSMAEFVRLDEDNNPIFDHDLKKPVIEFTGTVKLHGTHAGIQYNCETGELVAQSRSQIVKDGHFGFPIWLNKNRKDIIEICELLKDPDTKTVVLFGEWAGIGIQKGVGVSTLPPTFYLFDIALVNLETEGEIVWSNTIVSENKVFHTIDSFPTYKVAVDFNEPAIARDQMLELVEAVEKECPVTKQLGGTGIGEGIVFTGEYKGKRLRFKVKGEAHRVVGTKEKIPITDEDLKNIQELVNYTVTENRVKQGIQEVCNGELDKKHTGTLLKWIVKDIQSEEQDVIDKLGVNGYTKYISDAARKIFFKIIDGDLNV